MKPLLFIDFETQSEINIKLAGSYRYVEGVCFEPVCMSYSFLDRQGVQRWERGQEFPIQMLKESILVAHNAEFELNVLKSKWFEYQGIDTSWLTINNFIDTQAVARLFGYPAKLELLAKAMRVRHQKDTQGTKLINQLCVVKAYRNLQYKDSPAKFDDLYSYCDQDVRTTKACYDSFIKQSLSSSEQVVFAHMIEQNQIGFPIDIESVRQIRKVLDEYKTKCNDEIHRLTQGTITKGTQTVAIAKYIRDRGFHSVTSIAAPIVAEIMENEELDEHCRKLLKLRQQVSHSSTAKFERIEAMVQSDDRVRGNLKYYGGHTGRFASGGVQIHNLPRAQFDDPDAVIQDFFDLSLKELAVKYGNIGAAASKLIRPMIKAPEGKTLCVADYVSVENVCLHWTANDTQTIEDFENRLDQYKTYASRRFGVPYDEVTKEQRTYAKPCILGLGFGGGAGALQRVAANHGIELADKAAETDKKFYRSTFPMIPKLWEQVSSYMITAIRRGTIVELNTGTCSLKFIGRKGCAFIILPSGRFLAYLEPTIQSDAQYGNPCMTYMGVDSYTKQWRRLGDQERMVKGRHMPDMPIHGGRLVENIIQAEARDLLVNGMLKARANDFKVFGSVHDEILAEVNETATSSTLDTFCEVICELPEWAKGMPLRAEGYLGKRYRKG